MKSRPHRRPLSARLQERLSALPPAVPEPAPLAPIRASPAEPALKFCGKCQTFKPNKPPFFRPTQSICRFCQRK